MDNKEQTYCLVCNTCKVKTFLDANAVSSLVPVAVCSSCSGGKKYKCPSCGYVAKLKNVQ